MRQCGEWPFTRNPCDSQPSTRTCDNRFILGFRHFLLIFHPLVQVSHIALFSIQWRTHFDFVWIIIDYIFELLKNSTKDLWNNNNALLLFFIIVSSLPFRHEINSFLSFIYYRAIDFRLFQLSVSQYTDTYAVIISSRPIQSGGSSLVRGSQRLIVQMKYTFWSIERSKKSKTYCSTCEEEEWKHKYCIEHNGRNR